MVNPREKGEWTKNLGGIWFLCLFAGFMMGGVGTPTFTLLMRNDKPRTCSLTGFFNINISIINNVR